MSTRLPYGQVLLSYQEVRLITERVGIDLLARHRRNGGGTASPWPALLEELFTVACADPGIPAGDRLLDASQDAPITAGSVDPGEAYLSTQQVASRLSTSPRRVTEMLAKGRLHGRPHEVNESWQVAESEVARYEDEHPT